MKFRKFSPREFFTSEEYKSYLSEKDFVMEHDPMEENEYPPHYFMYYAYYVFGIPHEEMEIANDVVRLSTRAARSMAHQCLLDPANGPKDIDRITQVIEFLNSVSESKN